MRWIQLHTDERWQEFWNSPEVRDMGDMLRRTLVHATLDPEQRGVVRGRLLTLEQIPKLVAQLADQEQKEAEKIAESANVSVFDRFRAQLPKVY